MSMKDLELVRALCEKIGIKTVGQLEEFKVKTCVTNNEVLIRRLALYVSLGSTFEEVMDYKQVCD